MLSSPAAFEIGLLRPENGGVVFESLLRKENSKPAPEDFFDESFDTPSRSDRKAKLGSEDNVLSLDQAPVPPDVW